jgi:hypothetical protein
MYWVGILGNVPLSDTEGARLWGALTQGLRELGYVEGQNLVVEHLSTEGRSERLSALSAALVRWKPDVIVVPNNSNAIAVRRATQTIPVVAAAFSEESGLIASLARPGGNVTGLTLFAPEIAGKQLELLKEIVARVNRVAILWNPLNQSAQLYLDQARSAGADTGDPASGAGGATAGELRAGLHRHEPGACRRPPRHRGRHVHSSADPDRRSCREGAPGGDVHLERTHVAIRGSAAAQNAPSPSQVWECKTCGCIFAYQPGRRS